jgi:hypothetical protein
MPIQIDEEIESYVNYLYQFREQILHGTLLDTMEPEMLNEHLNKIQKVINRLSKNLYVNARTAFEYAQTYKYGESDCRLRGKPVEEFHNLIASTGNDNVHIASWNMQVAQEMSDLSELFNVIYNKLHPVPTHKPGVNETHCLLGDFNCERCKNHNHQNEYHLTFCLNECQACREYRKIRRNNSNKEAIHQANTAIYGQRSSMLHSQPINSNQQIAMVHNQQIPVTPNQQIPMTPDEPATPFQRLSNKLPDFIDTNDKYFYVLLTSSLDDGPAQYLVNALIANFYKMMPKSYPTKLYCYVTTLTQRGIPHLYGLIRYNSDGKYSISKKKNIFRNEIVSVVNGTRNERSFIIDQLTESYNKKRMTSKNKIINLYHDFSQYGEIQGDSLERFLMDDSELVTEPRSVRVYTPSVINLSNTPQTPSNLITIPTSNSSTSSTILNLPGSSNILNIPNTPGTLMGTPNIPNTPGTPMGTPNGKSNRFILPTTGTRRITLEEVQALSNADFRDYYAQISKNVSGYKKKYTDPIKHARQIEALAIMKENLSLVQQVCRERR